MIGNSSCRRNQKPSSKQEKLPGIFSFNLNRQFPYLLFFILSMPPPWDSIIFRRLVFLPFFIEKLQSRIFFFCWQNEITVSRFTTFTRLTHFLVNTHIFTLLPCWKMKTNYFYLGTWVDEFCLLVHTNSCWCVAPLLVAISSFDGYKVWWIKCAPSK